MARSCARYFGSSKSQKVPMHSQSAPSAQAGALQALSPQLKRQFDPASQVTAGQVVPNSMHSILQVDPSAQTTLRPLQLL